MDVHVRMLETLFLVNFVAKITMVRIYQWYTILGMKVKSHENCAFQLNVLRLDQFYLRIFSVQAIVPSTPKLFEDVRILDFLVSKFITRLMGL